MKTFIMIPTYNEKENIKNLIAEILKLKIKNLEIVVVDDNSPDGTSEIIKNLSKTNKKIHLLKRTKNKGRGYAGKDGFIYAINHKADIVIEMDADFSHNPKYIPKLIQALKGADLVLGSRMIKDGKEVGRSPIRKLITYFANTYIRVLLGLKVQDCNSGFRCFRAKVLKSINLKKLESKGPSIVQEVLFKAHLKGFKIIEIPITFVDREKGESKLGIPQLAQGYWMVLKLKCMKIFGAI